MNSSTTHTAIVPTTGDETGFSHSNSKDISTPFSTNDTTQWAGHSSSPVENVFVALASKTSTQTTGVTTCDVVDGPGVESDVSILGVGPGRTWRKRLMENGHTSNLDWSIYFKKPKGEAPFDRFEGTGRVDAGPPCSAFKEKMGTIPLNSSSLKQKFYKIDIPSLTIRGKQIRHVQPVPYALDPNVILLDSGTTADSIPFNSSDMAAAGLINYHPSDGFIYFAYNGSCASIPEDLTLDYHFQGVTKHGSVTVEVPVRNYAYGAVPGVMPQICNLADLQPDNNAVGNTFGAPFFLAAALHFKDAEKTVGMAQGGL